jgi:CubicO group peptidase (beta-lactamase class C family)
MEPSATSKPAPDRPAAPRGGLSRRDVVAAALAAPVILRGPALQAAPATFDAMTRDLRLEPPGRPAFRADLSEAMERLPVRSVGLALLAGGGTEPLLRGYGRDGPDPLYQAASISKLVTAMGVLRLVQEGRLELDMDVTSVQTSWRLPPSPFTRDDPVTLRRLLAMNAGIGVPGFAGYAPGSPIPGLRDILDGRPPATSAPVRSEARPGERWAYSGGSYEIIESLVEDVTGRSFAAAMKAIALDPLGMRDTVFAQPLPADLAAGAARGHDAKGDELPGGWRIVPELAAGGAWSTPRDIALMLADFGASWRGEDGHLLSPETAREMLSVQEPGSYGLGAAVAGEDATLVAFKRCQNIGYQAAAVLFPASGTGLVVMTGSDNGTTLANALMARAGEVFGWPRAGGWPE